MVERREFLRSCAGATFLVLGHSFLGSELLAADIPFKPYKKALLVSATGKAMGLEDIKKDTAYIFNYPYAATPNFLMNVDLEVKPRQMTLADKTTYKASSGLGKEKTIVAYTAICPHQWSYPNPEFSVINYYDKKDPACTQGVQLVKCCAHQSIFDPKNGAVRLDGPAENPLASVILEYDEKKNELYAVGIAGKDQYTEFFDLHKQDLRKLYGSSAAAKEEVEKAKVILASKYSKETIKC